LKVECLESRHVLSIAPIGPWTDAANITYQNDAFFQDISSSFLNANVASLIHIHTPNDVTRVRNDLIQYVWKGAGFPYQVMPQVTYDVPSIFRPDASYPYPPLPNLGRTDRLHLPEDYGLWSNMYLFLPRDNYNQRLVIWQQGHNDDLGAGGGYNLISYFLQQGYSVLASWMPLFGENALSQPIHANGCTIDPDTFDGSHDVFFCLETPTFSPMKYFLEPIAAGLNYVLPTYQFTDVTMIGLSGGGCITTLYAALDPRVRASFPVAGSQPLNLTTPPYEGLGDYAQWNPPFYAIANYYDLYIMGSYGPGRKEVQILNQYDSCCFAGVRFRVYQDYIKDAVNALGSGSFNVFLSTTNSDYQHEYTHMVSSYALTASIIHEMNDDSVQYVISGENAYWNGGNTDRNTYATTGPWVPKQNAGFGGGLDIAHPGTGNALARWQFKVTPGLYQVAATWVAAPGQAKNAPYTIWDGDTLLNTVTVNQRRQPNDFQDADVGWTILGNFYVTGDQLVIRLSNAADGPVVANGLRIVPLTSCVAFLCKSALQTVQSASQAVVPLTLYQAIGAQSGSLSGLRSAPPVQIGSLFGWKSVSQVQIGSLSGWRSAPQVQSVPALGNSNLPSSDRLDMNTLARQVILDPASEFTDAVIRFWDESATI
jgi:pimeloyl-ACP methyl ester carboxylesterase